MRVVILSKALLVGAYQSKLAALGAYPDLEVIALVPPSWHDRRGRTTLETGPAGRYRVQSIPLWLNGNYHLHFYPTLYGTLNRLQPDLLHVDEEPYNLATWQALAWARHHRVPSCFFTWQNLLRRYPPPFRWFERMSYRWANHAIAGSQDAAKVLRAKGYSGALQVIPQFGVDTDTFRPATKPPRREPFVIGYAGGLLPEKGIALLLRAVAQLDGAWQLHLVGDGPQRETLLALAVQLGIAQRVRITPRVPSTAMPAVYHHFDLLVLPSLTRPNWKEQFGRVLVEAMASGLPVVGSDSGEIPNVIGDAGLIVPEGDVRALIDALATLQNDAGLRAHLAAKGRARVEAHFSQAHIAAATYALYRQCRREALPLSSANAF